MLSHGNGILKENLIKPRKKSNGTCGLVSSCWLPCPNCPHGGNFFSCFYFTSIRPRLVFRNPCKTPFFSLCFHGQKKYKMLCSLWQYIRRRTRRKVQRGKRREGKNGREHKNKAIILGREKTSKGATSFTWILLEFFLISDFLP